MPRTTVTRSVSGSLEVRESPQVVSAVEAIPPSTSSDGVGCAGFDNVAIAIHTIPNGPTYSLEIWLFDGTAWAQASDGAGAPVVLAGLTATFAQILNIVGFDRIHLRVSALAQGPISRSYTFKGLG